MSREASINGHCPRKKERKYTAPPTEYQSTLTLVPKKKITSIVVLVLPDTFSAWFISG
jgi:hypothetical protein